MSAYSDAVLALSPVGYWRLGEASGTTAVDAVGANNGTIVNAPTLGVAGLLDGDTDTAVTLNGSSQSVNVPHAADAFGSSLTVVSWVKLVASPGAQNHTVAADYLDSTHRYACVARRSATGNYVAWWDSKDGWKQSSVSLTTNVRHQVAWVVSGGNVRMYVDGAPCGSAIAGATVLTGLNDLKLGWSGSGTEYLQGTLDDTAYFSGALTSAQIAALWAIGTHSGTGALALTATLTATGRKAASGTGSLVSVISMAASHLLGRGGQPKHRHDMAHVGLVPAYQLAAGTPTDGDVPVMVSGVPTWGASRGTLRMRAATLDVATNAAPILIGHRGYSRAAPENTLAAFAAAIAAGVTCIELDVQFDHANIPVILHDTTLDRTCTLPGNVAEYPAASLRTLDNGTSYAPYFATEGVPSLAEVFRQFGGRVAMIIEIKAAPAGGTLADAEDIVAALIHTFGLDAYCVIACFSLMGGSAWATYGIPCLLYTSTIATDGTVGGASPALWVAAGYPYLGLQLGVANFTTGSAAWVAAGARVIGWTAYGQYDASQMLAAPSITGVLCSDPSYLTNAYRDAVGSPVHFAGAALPRGATHYYYHASGNLRVEVLQPNAMGLTCGIAGGDRIGWFTYGGANFPETLVCGTCRGGAAGVGLLSVSMKLEAAAADTAYWGGIGWMTDDRGHVHYGMPSSSGYFGILRASGAMGLYAANSDGSETVLGTDAAGGALTVGSSYTMTLEITATNVIFTANGRTISVADTTYRSAGMVAALYRNRAAVSFTGLVRVS